MNKLLLYYDLFFGVGPKYWLYWGYHAIQVKSGLLKRRFPIGKQMAQKLSLENWRKLTVHDWLTRANIKNKGVAIYPESDSFRRTLGGEIQYFSGNWHSCKGDDKWVINPITGVKYSASKHWSAISDFSIGEDIKYIWEAARFNFCYEILRHDAANDTDHSDFIWEEIISFINHAPLNAGPNYMSSQEIAIRIINWTIFLQYYKHSESLTEQKFQTISDSIYNQAIHIRDYLGFAQHLVRNNHILLESAALFTVGAFFPTANDAKQLMSIGWKTFEQEIKYQILNDGSYIQHSFNYQRVMIRIFTWMVQAGKANNYTFSQEAIQKGISTINFLKSFVVRETGHVANYSSNDGTYLFPFTSYDYSDYRIAISTLSLALGNGAVYPNTLNDAVWFGLNPSQDVTIHAPERQAFHFKDGGYYLINDTNSKTFVRCTTNMQRPHQADNLHVDIFWKSINLMRDAGSYQYNSSDDKSAYFFSTKSHNTVSINNLDQMLKGPRFVWFFWSECISVKTTETDDEWQFSGKIKAFRHSGKWQLHHRKITKSKHTDQWQITDTIESEARLTLTQFWHPHPSFHKYFSITSHDELGNVIPAVYSEGHYSPTYGIILPAEQISFSTNSRQIITEIKMRQHE